MLSQDTRSDLKALWQCFKALQKARNDLATQRDGLTKAGDAAGLDALSLALRDKLAEFNAEIRRNIINLPDGRELLRHEHEGLRAFAINNNLTIQQALEKVVIKNSTVFTADFSNLRIHSLQGLGSLFGLRELNLANNPLIQSLSDVPKQLVFLDASNCGLSGNLEDIAGMHNLKTLDVSENVALTTLQGIPNRVEVLWAMTCSLIGDLGAIRDHKKLRRINVSHNGGLTSLEGTPNQVKAISALSCGLNGNLGALAALGKLRELQVSHNKGLTSLEGAPAKVEEIRAWDCGLTGDQGAIGNLTRLRILHVSGNPNLDREGLQATIRSLRAAGAPLVEEVT